MPARYDTLWRQGHILSAESATELDLNHPESDDTIVVVISHDCDLLQNPEIEPICEVIVGHIIENKDGNCTNGKHPRKLHIELSAKETKVMAEFVAANKRAIDKNLLNKHPPAKNVALTPDELRILQSWLAARYRRGAFPDQFISRFDVVKAKFAKIIEATQNDLLVVLLEVDDLERTKNEDTYPLGILLIYEVVNDPEQAEATAQKAAQQISELFQKTYLVDGKWQGIELRMCEAISADAITVHQARLLKAWYFDYLSLRTNPQGETF
jgi:hypothetical protein